MNEVSESESTGDIATAVPADWARAVIAAGALITDSADRILLVKPSYKPGWEIPGGMVEAGEAPAHAVRRELAEELGITPWVGRLLAVDWAPVETMGDKVLFVFDCGRLDSEQAAAMRVDGVEIVDCAYFPRVALDRLLIARLARRMHAAIAARSQRAVAYLEHGIPPCGG